MRQPPDEEQYVDAWNIAELDVEPHHPEVLRTDPEGRLIAIHLPAGERLQEHHTHERSYLFVAAGRIEVTHDGESVSGGPGFIAEFDRLEDREITATEDARLALLLAPWPGEGHSSQRAGG